jgi:hypothetical protein
VDLSFLALDCNFSFNFLAPYKMGKVTWTKFQIEEDEKRSYYVALMTINPNKVKMSDDNKQILNALGEAFFENIERYFKDPSALVGEVEVNLQAETGQKYHRDHLQCMLRYACKYKQYTDFDLDLIRSHWYASAKKYFGTDTIHLDVNVKKDTARQMQQYVEKK